MENNKSETWLPVKGYEALYEISNQGRIRRIFYKGKSVKWVLQPKLTKKGYLAIGLRDYEADTRKWYFIHRLVAIAFIPNTENKPQVNHINTIKTDNAPDNLEWSTALENIQHSWENGLCSPTPVFGEQNGKSKLTEKQVIEMKGLFKTNMTAKEIADKYNVSIYCVHGIKYNKNWKNVS